MPICPSILRSETEFAACVPLPVAKLFWPRAQQRMGLSWVIGQQQALRAGGATIPSALVFELVPTVISGGTEVFSAATQTVVGATYETAQPNNLGTANFWWACELTSEMPLDLARKIAIGGGAREGMNEIDTRAAAAIILAAMATQAGLLIPEVIDQAEKTKGAGGNTGNSFFEKFGSGIGKLFQNPGEWAQRVFITEPGKAIQWAGRQMLATFLKGAWGWVLDPLGFAKVFAVFLRELGAAAVAGALDVFEEQEFMKTMARHWAAVGAALVAVSGFLPPPWNIVALAVGAIFTAAGAATLAIYADAERARRAENLKNQQQAEAEAARVNCENACAEIGGKNCSEYCGGGAPALVDENGNVIDTAQTALLGPVANNRILGLDSKTFLVLGFGALVILYAARKKF